ncbi:hypothetical protein EEW87_001850 [Janibacter melonis]|uniref:Uncharacterized protein n=1 Tax=Janibacter melonis TaxID=262209 RepID=A0A5P8FIL8_9MICO|nr:hypothetical protein [Janibacter melonis]QFQ29336.2 hypothetical protein EEW87_001850 [Janibacter melonis]
MAVDVLLALIGVVCVLVVIAAAVVAFVLMRRSKQQESAMPSYDAIRQAAAEQTPGAHTRSSGTAPYVAPHESTSPSGAWEGSDESGAAPRETSTEPTQVFETSSAEPASSTEGTSSTEPASAITESAPTAAGTDPQQAPVVHAPSDDVEQTVRISRSSARPVEDLSASLGATASTPPPPSPAVSPSAEPITPEPTTPEPGTPEPTPAPEPVAHPSAPDPVEPPPAPAPAVTDDPGHTYWDDEEAERERRAESLADDDTTPPARAVVDGGYGWGSAAPFADGSMPPGHPVKGHREWMQYHEPGSPWYDETTVDVWFADAATAERAGFHRA